MSTALLFDIGSTFTKVAAVDIDGARVLARGQHPTTASSDVTVGLRGALRSLNGFGTEPPAMRLCSSSARGGLRLIAVGLVASLTAEAARQAALGAGARVVGVFARDLTPSDVAEIERLAPDVVLLAGGTDGGDRDVIERNAETLAASAVGSPVIMAGNRVARPAVERAFARSEKRCYVAENVLPELDRLNVEPARAAIREVFVRHIVDAKGLDRAKGLVDGVVEPTPAAVLAAAQLLAQGTADEEGLGDVMVIDVGGATTDVHSVATTPPGAGLVPHGLPEPVAKRTVEGDLGLRVSAPAVIELARANQVRPEISAGLRTDDALRYAARVSTDTAFVAETEADRRHDLAMAAACADVAVERHVGHVTEVYGARGPVRVLRGKDLRAVRALVGVGGVFRLPGSSAILRAALARPDLPGSMRPDAPVLYHDASYVMYAAGLLGPHHPTAALRLLKAALIRQE